ncbi:hypothetical protein BDQ17DRAFT_1411505 [Cyathus striatus]|nr:hypothetical protein BDQ17DRAFT_1411505 [Cyathus striatus]
MLSLSFSSGNVQHKQQIDTARFKLHNTKFGWCTCTSSKSIQHDLISSSDDVLGMTVVLVPVQQWYWYQYSGFDSHAEDVSSDDVHGILWVPVPVQGGEGDGRLVYGLGAAVHAKGVDKRFRLGWVYEVQMDELAQMVYLVLSNSSTTTAGSIPVMEREISVAVTFPSAPATFKTTQDG